MSGPVRPDTIVIRKCSGTDEFHRCVALQQQVWNFSDAELVPLRMFVVADKVGGQVIGAFDGSELVGFALSVPGHRNGHAAFEQATRARKPPRFAASAPLP